MVMDGDGHGALRGFLADHILIEMLANLMRGRDAAVLLADEGALGLFPDDVIAELDALVADEHRRAGNELTDLVLRLSAEGAI